MNKQREMWEKVKGFGPEIGLLAEVFGVIVMIVVLGIQF